MSSTYCIAFDGDLVSGFGSEQVRAGLVGRFRMSEAKVATILSGRRIVLKKGLSAPQAQAYARELAAIGMKVAIVAQDPDAPAGDGTAFRIVYRGGLLPRFDAAAVRAAAAARLKLTDAQLRAVFSGREIGLKKGLDEAGARRYFDALRSIGMDVSCDPPLTIEAPQSGPVPAPGPTGDDPAVDEVERQMMETAFWADPSVQQNRSHDEVDRRLLAAMAAEFELPTTAPTDADFPTQGGHTGTDLNQATRHLAETMLNGNALNMYASEIAEAEARVRAPAAVAEPLAPRAAPQETAAAEFAAAAAEDAPAPPVPPVPVEASGVAPGAGPASAGDEDAALALPPVAPTVPPVLVVVFAALVVVLLWAVFMH